MDTSSSSPANRLQLMEGILEIVTPLLGYLVEPLDGDFRGIVLIPPVKDSHGLALTENGFYGCLSQSKHPWKNTTEVSLSADNADVFLDRIYGPLISALKAKRGLDNYVQQALIEIHALVRQYASLGLSTEPLVSYRQSITDVSFNLESASFSDGKEETRLLTNFSALCPLRRSGCTGFARCESVFIAIESVLGKMIMLFTPEFLSNGVYRSENPLYCNGADCACAFRLSSRQIIEVVQEAKNFLRSRGYGFEPI